MALKEPARKPLIVSAKGNEFVEREFGRFERAVKGKRILSPAGRRKLRQKLGILPSQIIEEEKRLARHPVESIMIPGLRKPFEYVPQQYAGLLSVMNAFFKGVKGRPVLEIGAGGTGFLKEIKSRGGTVSALDSLIERNEPGIDWRKGRIERLDSFFEGQEFDCVVAKYVFEVGSLDGKTDFWADRKAKSKALRDVNRKLKRGGLFLLQYGNKSPISIKDLEAHGFRVLFEKHVPALDLNPEFSTSPSPQPVSPNRPIIAAVKIKPI